MIEIIPFVHPHQEPIKTILKKTAAFRDDEICVAMELITLYLEKKDDYQIYTAVDYDDVLGYVCFGKIPLTLHTFDLYWIAVDKEKQHRGIGKKLIDFTIQKIKEQGGTLLLIQTSSQEKYQDTQTFYFKIGCKLEAQIKNFYAPNDDLLLYTKQIL